MRGDYHVRGEKGGETFELTELTEAPPTPSTPQTGNRKLHPKFSGWHEIDDTGAERRMLNSKLRPLHGARLSFVSVTTVRVGTTSEDSVVGDSTGVELIEFNGTLDAVVSGTGAGGLDTGSEAANTWYAVHIIGDSTGVNVPDVLLSISATAPTLPSTHDLFRRVGWVRNNPSSDFLKFEQFDNGPDRRVEYDEEQSVTRILSGGDATVFTTVSAAKFVPPTVRHGIMHYEWDPGTPSGTFNIRPNGSTVSIPTFTISTRNDTEAGSHPFFTDTSQDIQFKVASATDSLDLFVGGYVDNL